MQVDLPLATFKFLTWFLQILLEELSKTLHRYKHFVCHYMLALWKSQQCFHKLNKRRGERRGLSEHSESKQLVGYFSNGMCIDAKHSLFYLLPTTVGVDGRNAKRKKRPHIMNASHLLPQTTAGNIHLCSY